MKTKTRLVIGAAILFASVFYVSSQQSAVSQSRRADPVPGISNRPFDDPSDAVAPFRIDRNTGELKTAKGEVVDDPVLNNPERRHERLMAAWAIENPREYWKITKPAFPPKGDPRAPQFDILRQLSPGRD